MARIKPSRLMAWSIVRRIVGRGVAAAPPNKAETIDSTTL